MCLMVLQLQKGITRFFRHIVYSLFTKTLPKSILQMHWISVWLYEMGDTYIYVAV